MNAHKKRMWIFFQVNKQSKSYEHNGPQHVYWTPLVDYNNSNILDVIRKQWSVDFAFFALSLEIEKKQQLLFASGGYYYYYVAGRLSTRTCVLSIHWFIWSTDLYVISWIAYKNDLRRSIALIIIRSVSYFTSDFFWLSFTFVFLSPSLSRALSAYVFNSIWWKIAM